MHVSNRLVNRQRTWLFGRNASFSTLPRRQTMEKTIWVCMADICQCRKHVRVGHFVLNKPVETVGEELLSSWARGGSRAKGEPDLIREDDSKLLSMEKDISEVT